MFQLIVKDFKFNKKNIYISTLVSLLGYYLISQDGERYKVLACTLIPLLMFNFVIGKICFIEDRDKVYKYIHSLPLKKSDFVLSKYVEGAGVLIFSFAFIFVENYFLKLINKNYFNLDINYIMLIFSIMLIYIGMFIFIYFRFNYQIANQTLIVFYILCLIGYKIFETLNINMYKIISWDYFNVMLFIISIFLYGATFQLSKRCYYKKDE